MPKPLASPSPLVHPHQIEIQEFDWYTLVIDARSAAAYSEDRLPGSVNIPAQRVGSSAASESMIASGAAALPHALQPHVNRLIAGDTVLVYCDRGGLDSMVWAAPLRAVGLRVDVLGGGWGNYRRWVDAGLNLMARVLTFRLLEAAPGMPWCQAGSTLCQRDEQVLDIAAITGESTVPVLNTGGGEPLSQHAFESLLLDALRRFDLTRPVYVSGGSAALGDLSLPPALLDAIQRSAAGTAL